MRHKFQYNPKQKTRRYYPDNWNSLGKGLTARDGDKCFRCGKTRDQLRKLGMRLVKAHIFSVRTGNNRKTNLRWLCDKCHEKDPKHEHLRKQRIAKETKYGGLNARLKQKKK